ncbi:glycosyltransferase family 4 protein [Bradyrhizobium jicamae]|uniref:Glycosyltransferase family 4 protein n=1 Tax=Bradyrhizobium jicamae TaxID=280332 RepID=A0ABS5FYB3_9BRAD|nr:glycosyltransferase family 4 protein [Bradyrhizobium jicamae]MBR0801700.1 glycosyltransferase family 4 protein [Bradyrhizobium jicamae]
MADAWTGMGHRVVVVSAGFHHLHMRPRKPGPQRIGGVDFWFLETPSYSNGSLGRLWNNLYFGHSFRLNAKKIAKLFGKPDLIIASSPHLFFIPAAQKMARRFGAKFWVEIRDLWPESIVALGMTPAWHPLIRWLAWLERRTYRAADRVVCLLANAEALMRSRGLAPKKFTWIPNGVSDEEIQRALGIETVTHPLVDRIKQLKARGRRIVLYAGGMGPPNAMEVIVDAARVLAGTSSDVHFMLGGSGSSRTELEQRAANLTNVEFQEEVDRPVVHAMLRLADCAVVSFHRNALYEYGISPNKLFDYCLFAPRSVIACEAKGLTGLEGLVSLRCTPDDASALAEALAASLRGPERTLLERVSAVQHFSYSRLAQSYLEATAESSEGRQGEAG